ncbi:torsin-1A-like isoform X1 [Arctopsyche grandis]
MKLHWWITNTLLISLITIETSAEFFTLTTLAISSLGAYISYNYRCHFMECCDKKEIPYDITALKYELKREVFGQPMVDEAVHALAAHITDYKMRRPGKKALTMSFHGWTGSGKNFVASIIAKSLYKKGMESPHVKMYIGRHHFPSQHRIFEYRERLISEIKSLVKLCPTALIIFDEINDIPQGVIDVIKPMIDHHSTLDGIDYSGAVFILISNVGGSEITDHFINLGKPREDVVFADFESTIRDIAYDEGGFKDSSVIYSQLIDHYIPFLPLEQRHIKECAIAEFKAQGSWNPTAEMIDDVMSVITYGPPGNELYANAGCKRIKKQVSYVLRKYSNVNY